MNTNKNDERVEGPQQGARKGRYIKASAVFVIVAIAALIPVFVEDVYMLHILILVFLYTIASVSFRTITVSGQFPLAHGAFMGIGAYLTAMTTRWLGWSPWFTIPSAALITAGIGMLLGFPFSRLRSLYYAMGSLFFGIGVLRIVYAFGDVTGGYSGMVGIPPLFTGSKVYYYYLFLALALASIAALYRFEFSRIGTNLKAIAQSHLVASSVGINEGFYRILAVGVGCFFAGLTGAGYAHYNRVISPASFDFMATMWLVMYVLIGGIDSFTGPVIGTFVLILIPEYFRDLKMYAPFISAVLLGVVVYLMPKGIASLPSLVFRRKRAAAQEAPNVT